MRDLTISIVYACLLSIRPVLSLTKFSGRTFMRLDCFLYGLFSTLGVMTLEHSFFFQVNRHVPVHESPHRP